MQALILVGGEGTRLRPLTAEIPKPVVTLVDRPFLAYMLEWLAVHGVEDVIMSCGFKAEKVRAVLGDGGRYGVRIRYAEEPEPLGTGGALKFCEDLLDERFLMLNGDVLTDIDLTAQIAQHERTGAVGTLALVAVPDPSNYGLVRTAEDASVLEFIEKPQVDVGVNTISAGAYVLERSVLDLLEPGRRASIEREVFPRLVGNGLYARVSDGYWLDIGTPDRYLQGTFDILSGAVATQVRPRDGVVQGSNCSIEGEVLAPAVLGDDVVVGRRSVVERAVLLDGVRVGADCVLRDCIVVPRATVADGERAEPGDDPGVSDLSPEAVAKVDSSGQAAEIRDLPVHLSDALWRVESASIAPQDSAGLAICGMGGSGIGAQLAIAAIGDRAARPIVAVRDYSLPSWVGEDWTVLLSSYSGNTEETLACWDAAAHARRIVVSTGGALVERARAEKVPVIPLPGGFQPRAAVGYATVVALEVATLAGAAPSLRAEVEAAAALLGDVMDEFDDEARALADALHGRIPVIAGAGLTAPVAYRWKCQVNENANRPAFASEMPELDHNEIEGWGDRSLLEPVFLEDAADGDGRLQRRFELTAEIIGGAHRVRSRGETRVERLMSLVLLGDLVSLYLAVLDGTDPAAIPALQRLKAEL